MTFTTMLLASAASLILFTGAGELSLSSPALASANTELLFHNAGCRVAFRYPADWKVTQVSTETDTPCRFQLRPLAWDSLIVAVDSFADAYTVRVSVEPKGLEAMLPSTGFSSREGSWFVSGQHGTESEATGIARNGWRGAWGEPLSRCYRIDGPYVGTCELPVAIVGTEERSAQVWGGKHTFDVFERVLETLELRP